MEFKIKPYVGVGDILLGMTSEQIQKVMDGPPSKKFKRFKDAEFDIDRFASFFVYYRHPGVCEAIEFFGEATVLIDGKALLGRSFSEVKKFLEAIDSSLSIDNSGLTSFKYGVGVYAPFAQDEPDEPVESVIVFEKGYYD